MHRPSTPFSWNERRSAGMSIQPQRRARPVTEPNSLPRLPSLAPVVVGQLGGERTGAHARRVRLDDAEHVIEHPRSDAAARRGRARDAVGARHVRIRAVVDVEQRALRAFEQQRLAARARLVDQRGDVADHRHDLASEREQLVAHRRERQRRRA